MSSFDSKTEGKTNDRFKKRGAPDSIVAQGHIDFEFFSRLLNAKRPIYFAGLA